jgi:hypothetical protein
MFVGQNNPGKKRDEKQNIFGLFFKTTSLGAKMELVDSPTYHYDYRAERNLSSDTLPYPLSSTKAGMIAL